MWIFWEINGSYQVGYFMPNGDKAVMYSYDDKRDAEVRVHFLNGGSCATFQG